MINILRNGCQEYVEELPELLQLDILGQLHLDSQARILHTRYISQVASQLHLSSILSGTGSFSDLLENLVTCRTIL
jgi:hypothetical protein